MVSTLPTLRCRRSLSCFNEVRCSHLLDLVLYFEYFLFASLCSWSGILIHPGAFLIAFWLRPCAVYRCRSLLVKCRRREDQFQKTILTSFFSLHRSPGPHVPPKIVAAAAAKATCFLEFGLDFGVRILWNMIRPPSSPTTLSMHWCGTDWCTMIAFDFVCQNCNPRSCARDNFTLNTAFWSPLQWPS